MSQRVLTAAAAASPWRSGRPDRLHDRQRCQHQRPGVQRGPGRPEPEPGQPTGSGHQRRESAGDEPVTTGHRTHGAVLQDRGAGEAGRAQGRRARSRARSSGRTRWVPESPPPTVTCGHALTLASAAARRHQDLHRGHPGASPTGWSVSRFAAASPVVPRPVTGPSPGADRPVVGHRVRPLPLARQQRGQGQLDPDRTCRRRVHGPHPRGERKLGQPVPVRPHQ